MLNGNRRVHDDPGFGRCLKLREQETILFWRLVWKFRDANPLEPWAEASPATVPPAEANITAHNGEVRPQKAAPWDLSLPTSGEKQKKNLGGCRK